MDFLRALAIFGVIASHIFLIWPDAEVMHFKIVSFRQIFMYAVPLFLLISGSLLLNRDIELGDFFKRRLSRIISPFLFYMIIHVCVLLVLLNLFTGFEGLASYLNKVPFQYNWYFWMILGLYITLPVINKFVQYASEKELDYFVLVLFGGSIFYQITFILGIQHYVNLNLVLCPIAYMVLGYYLANKDFKMSKNKIIFISILMILAVTVIKILAADGYIPFEYVTGYDMTKTSRVATQVDLAIFELLRVSSIFLMFRFIYESRSGIVSRIKNILENDVLTGVYTSISRASYGMYLFHITLFAILSIVLSKCHLSGSQVCLYIIILILALNIASWLVVLAVDRIPFIKKFSGYH